MAQSVGVSQTVVVAGLGTTTFTMTTAGQYWVQVSSTVPYIASGTAAFSDGYTGPNQTGTYIGTTDSQLQIVVNKNGSPQLTLGGATNNPSATQPSVAGAVKFSVSAADTVTVVLTSTSASDAIPNAVKTTINIFQGQ